MRAWARHDPRFAIPIDFDPAHGGVAGNLIALAPAFGMKASKAKEILRGLLEQTHDYPERVMALDSVPLERRRRLVDVVNLNGGGLSRNSLAREPGWSINQKPTCSAGVPHASQA